MVDLPAQRLIDQQLQRDVCPSWPEVAKKVDEHFARMAFGARVIAMPSTLQPQFPSLLLRHALGLFRHARRPAMNAAHIALRSTTERLDLLLKQLLYALHATPN
jgi:hypothetical protein